AAIGWLEGEFDALGVPFKERVSRTEEALTLMRALWTETRPELQTARHRLSGVQVSPAPLQKPRPPLWIGGMSEGALRRVARFGDGWHATAATPETFAQGKATVTKFWREAGRAGEPAWSLRVPVFIDGVHRWAVDEKLLRGRHGVRGTVEQVTEQLAAYQRLGMAHVALEVSYSVYPAILETIELLATEVKPALAR
ncbi:MAG: LLM class flavin-dependent oxidoreductase, partial [Candidatus Rokubacteria bacterium]|nr:LLM class flavin-dependent oxidoreductase [Candidatus Rokubacteria bacterium]